MTLLYHINRHFSIKEFQNINRALVNRREHFSWKAHDEPAQTGAGTRAGRKGNGLAPLPLLL